MTLGTFGSTLNDELNRLANGGTYRDMDDMVDEALAAKQWANRENISPYSTDTVGVLNEIAGRGTNRQNWLDFNGVCNYIAGTTGLPAAAALRQVYPTTDLLTGVASYYVDATAPTNWGSLGYVRFPGVFNNYLSIPDATELDITGDIDLRVQIAMDDWTPTASQRILVKGATNQQSYELTLSHSPAGFLNFRWSTDGVTLNTAASNAGVTFADGAIGWIRATRVASTGVTKFFTSTDGTTWTQLGTDVSTTAGNIFSGTGPIRIGENWDGGNPVLGNLYRAQVLNGIGGTTVLDVNIATDYKSYEQPFFTATTGQTVTVNGLGTIANLGNAGSLLPTTLGSSTSADSNDPKFLDHTGTNYVYLPGVASNFLSVPDANDLDITGDIDIRVQVALDDWTPSANNTLISKWNSASTNNRGWIFNVLTSGLLNLQLSADGTAQSAANSTVATGIADGSTKWVRATYRQSDRRVQFFTSDNGTSWTQLGADVTSAQTSIFSNNAAVNIGAFNAGLGGENFTGKHFRAQIYNGIDGTKVLDVDTSVITTGADTYVVPTTYTGQAGAYFTGSGLSLNGVSGNYVSAPDSAALDITGDIDLQVKAALTDWTPGAVNYLLGKYNSSNISYALRVDSAGTLGWVYSTNGTATTVRTSTVATGITDGATKWVRITHDVDNGASGNDVKFFLSDDGSTWTQLGTTITNAGTVSFFSGTAALEVGSIFAGTTGPAAGTFYRAIVKSGIDGYTVFDADFTQVPANALRMTESSINKAVVTLNTTRYATINRSTSGRKSVAVTQPTWLFGTDDYMEVNNRYMASGTYLYLPGVVSNYASTPDAAALDITGDIDVRVKVALDDWTPSATNTLLGKRSNTTTQQSYLLTATPTGGLSFSWSTAGTTLITENSLAHNISDGTTKWVRATLDVDNGASGYEVKFFLSDDGTTWTQLGTTITGVGTTSIFNSTAALEVGAQVSGLSSVVSRGKFFRAQVLNGIDGTVAFDANFETSITSLLQDTFTESSANAATVTINRSGSAYRSAGVIDAGYLYPGATNTFTASATDFLNFGATDSFTALVVVRQWATIATGTFIAKRIQTTTTTDPGWLLRDVGASAIGFTTGNASTATRVDVGTPASGTLFTLTGTYSNGNVGIQLNAGTAVTSTSTVASNPWQLRIGTDASGNAPIAMELIATAVFRSALTASQIRQITNYFANREVYL